MRRRSQSGDTLIEVLISIAVISGVLGYAYAMTNKNTMTLRDNEERTFASRSIQGQVEALRIYWYGGGRTSIDSFVAGGHFCIGNSAGSLSLVTISDPDISNSGYPAECKIDNMYFVDILKNSEGSYVVRTRWVSLGGSVGSVIMVYGFGG